MVDSLLLSVGQARAVTAFPFGNLALRPFHKLGGPLAIGIWRPAGFGRDIIRGAFGNGALPGDASQMPFTVRYHRGDAIEGDAETAKSLEEARKLVDAKCADLGCKAEVAVIFRISPSGTEELEESVRLHI